MHLPRGAQWKPQPTTKGPRDRTPRKKVQVYNFSGFHHWGKILSPNGQAVLWQFHPYVPSHPDFASETCQEFNRPFPTSNPMSGVSEPTPGENNRFMCRHQTLDRSRPSHLDCSASWHSRVYNKSSETWFQPGDLVSQPLGPTRTNLPCQIAWTVDCRQMGGVHKGHRIKPP